MNDTDLIVSALMKELPEKRKKLKLNEIYPEPHVPGKDAIWKSMDKQAKKEKQLLSHKKKSINQWTKLDFVRFLDSLLKTHMLQLERMTTRDGEVMGGIYDKMVRLIPEHINNEVLRDYIIWWVSAFSGSLHSKKIYVSHMDHDYMLNRFVQRYNVNINESTPILKKEPQVEVSDQEIYTHGGLEMLLASRGIVFAYQFLKSEQNIISKIAQSLKTFSKESLIEVIETTFRFGPYKKELRVDFLSIAKSALDYHSIKKYNAMEYQEHFV